MSASAWDEAIALPEGSTWLLEASAGTGKTYQIAGLFVRLVAEYDLPAERILAITFTNAAAAELRDRIRTRLRTALEAVRAGRAPGDDAVVARIVTLPSRDVVEKRLELALRGFDLAPISTIHGFSQRMLRELSFDSGQDPALELLADATEVIEQAAFDALATIYAGTPPDELVLLRAAGVTSKGLLAAARAMTKATAPEVSPRGDADLRGELARVSAWSAKVRALCDEWFGAGGRRALDALRSDARDKRFKAVPAAWIDTSIRLVDTWLAGSALGIDKAEKAFVRLHADALVAAWKGSPAELVARPYWPLLGALHAFSDEHDRELPLLAPLAGFARTVRPHVEGELLRRRALTFDGMLSRLAERIAATGGEDSPLASRIRERFDAVLVDEFQDTDAAQWSVLRAAFHGHGRLLLIGDPKQSIYAFRGADVQVYREAVALVEGSRRRTMVHNFRSDPRAIAAMNALFREGSRAFDDGAIDYVRVAAKREGRLEPAGVGLDLRWIDARVLGGSAGAPITRKDERLAARLAAREALAWLEGTRAKLVVDDAPRDVEPADLAVLVNGHHEAEAMRRALAQAGIPAVAASRRSVFDTEVAVWLAAWLDAVAGRGRDRSARAAVVTPLFGWSADELAWALAVADRGDEARAAAARAKVRVRDWDAWTARLAEAAGRFARHGFARTFDREAMEQGIFPRLLASARGERHATDLRHLFELLHVEERTRRASPGTLAAWLRAQAGTETDEAVQRLESDARAVQIETVHASKGLEYPIVFLPFAWSVRKGNDDGLPFIVRGAPSAAPGSTRGGGAVLHVEMMGTSARGAARALQAEEERREGLRKAYVALTRGKHRTIAWCGPIGAEGKRMSATALGRLVFRDPTRPGFDDDTMPQLDAERPEAWDEAKRRLDALAARSEGAIAWSAEGALDGLRRWKAPEKGHIPPRTAAWPKERASIASRFVVTSYSGLAAAADRDEKLAFDVVVSSDDAASDASTERDMATTPAPRPALATFSELPRLSLGGGTRYGTCVHAVLEQMSFATAHAKDGRSLDALVAETAARSGVGGDRPLLDELVARLPSLLTTPLDAAPEVARPPLLPRGFVLRDVTASDRFDEVRFDLRLGDGTRFRRASEAARGALDAIPGCVDPARLERALTSARDASSGAVRSWFDEQLSRHRDGEPLIDSVAGILTGSIDLVFRLPDGRYFLADYKTNRIGASSPGHYAAAWLDLAMADAGYPLQALLYTLALHRHLRARLGGYDYDRHVGGYLYLFLRGMAGPETPRDPTSGRCLGVFGDRWPRAVIEALDEAFCPTHEGAR